MPKTPSRLRRAWSRAICVGLCCAAAGCTARDVHPAATRPAGAAAARPVFYPPYAAPGRIVALGPITGTTEQATPPGAIRRAITGESATPEPASQLIRPLSLAVRGGRILVVDVGRRGIVEVEPSSGKMSLWEVRGLSDRFDPVAIASDGQGDVYIADPAGKRVVRVGADNTVGRTYTLPGDEAFVPIDLAVSSERLYVVNRAARRVDVFQVADGSYLGPFGAAAQGRGAFPVGVSVDADGRIYIVDMSPARVRVHDADGRLLRQLGRAGDRPGQFAQPRSVAVGPDGITYVSDVATQVVQMFDGWGTLLMYFDARGMPARIIADRTLLEVFGARMPGGFQPQYMLFVADQVNPPAIGVYAFGRMEQAAGEAR